MSSIASSAELSSPPRLLEQVRARIRFKHYSIRTEQAYVDWIKRFIRHFGKRHPSALGADEVQEFLTHLAVVGRVAASTQNQAKSALLFLYKEVLALELPWLDKIEAAKSDWILSFVGRSLDNLTPAQWAVKKDGGVFDQFAGATITPRKSVQAVNRGLQLFQAHQAQLINP